MNLEEEIRAEFPEVTTFRIDGKDIIISMRNDEPKIVLLTQVMEALEYQRSELNIGGFTAVLVFRDVTEVLNGLGDTSL